MISKEDKAKIEDFKEVFRMTVNPTNDEDINKVVDDLFKNVEYNYEEYKDEVPYISVNQETYKYHILQPVNGKYSLLDFLLNRAISNVDVISINNDNHFVNKGLSIDKNRYEGNRSSYSDDFIKKQYQKSRMHETGHAIHAWDVKQDDAIHSRVDFKKKVQLFNELLGYKYPNLLPINEIKNKLQNSDANWRGSKRAFVDPHFDEASTEYFATKFSKLYVDIDNYKCNYVCQTDDKNEAVYVPNNFNGYSTGACLMFHLENLVSKRNIFQSNFFSNNNAINEFIIKYSSVLEKVLKFHNEDLHELFLNKKAHNLGEKFATVFSRACTETPNDPERSKKTQENIALCYEIMNKIFQQSYLQELSAGRISKEQMLMILPMCYVLSPVEYNKEGKAWVDTPTRNEYKIMIENLKRRNDAKIKVTPDNISNVTSQTVQANPGEMSKRVQSVSKSFAESLKQNTHSNDDGEPSTRSGYRYAQVDTYNRKKGQSR